METIKKTQKSKLSFLEQVKHKTIKSKQRRFENTKNSIKNSIVYASELGKNEYRISTANFQLEEQEKECVAKHFEDQGFSVSRSYDTANKITLLDINWK